jgi:hypothetical protein
MKVSSSIKRDKFRKQLRTYQLMKNNSDPRSYCSVLISVAKEVSQVSRLSQRYNYDVDSDKSPCI